MNNKIVTVVVGALVVVILLGGLLIPAINSATDTFADTLENTTYNYKASYVAEYEIENVSATVNIINGIETTNPSSTVWVLSDALIIRMGADRTSFISPDYCGNIQPGDKITFSDGECIVNFGGSTYTYEFTKLSVPDVNGSYGAFFFGKTLYVPTNEPLFMVSLGFQTTETYYFSGEYIAGSNTWSTLSGPYDTTPQSATVPYDADVSVSIETTPYGETPDVLNLRLSADDVSLTFTPSDGTGPIAGLPADFFIVAPLVVSYNVENNAPAWFQIMQILPIMVIIALVVAAVAVAMRSS